MCLPLAPALAIASGAMSAAGSIVGGMQANAQGKYEAKLAKRNSEMEVEAYQEERGIAQDEARDFWRRVGAVKGQQTAAMAANNIDVNYGTAVNIAEDTQMQADEEFRNLTRNQQQRQRGHLINASNFTEEAKAARARGKAALVGSIFSAGSSLLGSASQAFGLKAKAGGGSSSSGGGGGSSYAHGHG